MQAAIANVADLNYGGRRDLPLDVEIPVLGIGSFPVLGKDREGARARYQLVQRERERDPGETTAADCPMPGTFEGVDWAAAATSAEWKIP